MSELIQIVDESDTPLRAGTMDEAQTKGMWHRIARVMVWDSETKRFLLQKVKPNPHYNGGKWNTSVSGHVCPDESYVDAAARETMEEMGLAGLDLHEVDRYKSEETLERQGRVRVFRRHNATYLGSVAAGELVVSPNPEEVTETLWISGKELVDMRSQNESSMTAGLVRFVDKFHINLDMNERIHP